MPPRSRVFFHHHDRLMISPVAAADPGTVHISLCAARLAVTHILAASESRRTGAWPCSSGIDDNNADSCADLLPIPGSFDNSSIGFAENLAAVIIKAKTENKSTPRPPKLRSTGTSSGCCPLPPDRSRWSPPRSDPLTSGIIRICHERFHDRYGRDCAAPADALYCSSRCRFSSIWRCILLL